MDEELKQLFTDMVVENREQKKQISSLLEAMGNIPNLGAPLNVRVQAPALDPVVARSDKIQRMALGLRKSHRVKDFKYAKDSNIREYIKCFDAEISSLKTMVGINDELNRNEYVQLFRDKMEYYVLKRIEQAFKANQGAADT